MGTLQIRNLSFRYPNQEKYALHQVNLTIEEGSFFLLCGTSGCGKSTLLRQMKPSLIPHGTQQGVIIWNETAINDMDFRTQSRMIGFVQQDPDYQIVTDKVWHELAFGLESLGYDTAVIRRRVAEIAGFFGIQAWFHYDTAKLSGGQKQLLNLASVLVMQPEILILDEPTSQLDPIAAADFLELLARVNREMGTTIILTEHRLEEAVSFATQLAVMEQGSIICSGNPKETALALYEKKHSMFLAMPCAMQLWAALSENQETAIPDTCPVSVRDGKRWLQDYANCHTALPLPPEKKQIKTGLPVIKADNIWYRYGKERPDILKGFCLTANEGECIAILGGNGTGKTTALKLLAGLEKPYRGNIQRAGTVMLLPQNPQTLFVKATVREDLLEAVSADGLEHDSNAIQYMLQIAERCQLSDLLERHPYDLSGGEQQRAALAKLLLLEPDILLLDEPTKGFDIQFKRSFAEILNQLKQKRITVIMVSHDIEFCARYADRCMLFFDGAVIAEGTARTFFSGNTFYTTAANRIARNILLDAVTVEDILAAYSGPLSDGMPKKYEVAKYKTESSEPKETRTSVEKKTVGIEDNHGVSDRKKLPFRTIVCIGILLLMIPVTVIGGTGYLHGNNYYAVAILVLMECMLPFFLAFEGRKPQTREIVLVAVICAIAVAGRAVFFMLPQCKPVLAVVILAGSVLGAEAGFLIGALSMLISNMLFGQGVWTPWQMFAMGFVGCFAGFLFRNGILPRKRIWLCMFGLWSAICFYGVIMNLSSALLYAGWNLHTIMAYLISGFPMDCIHGAATWIFLWLAAEPVIEKLERIKEKYGILL